MDKKITLESIALEKAELQQRMDHAKEVMKATSIHLMTEETPLTHRERIMNSISKGMAVVDGVMLGYKIFRRTRSFFRWKKRK